MIKDFNMWCKFIKKENNWLDKSKTIVAGS